jgi:hypothetical protein
MSVLYHTISYFLISYRRCCIELNTQCLRTAIITRLQWCPTTRSVISDQVNDPTHRVNLYLVLQRWTWKDQHLLYRKCYILSDAPCIVSNTQIYQTMPVMVSSSLWVHNKARSRPGFTFWLLTQQKTSVFCYSSYGTWHWSLNWCNQTEKQQLLTKFINCTSMSITGIHSISRITIFIYLHIDIKLMYPGWALAH